MEGRSDPRGVAFLALVVLVTLGIVVVPASSHAQQRPDPTPVVHAGTPPEACLWAPFFANHLRTGGRPDTSNYTLASDTVSAVAMAAVRACLQGSDSTPPSPWQLESVVRSRLLLGDDAGARVMTQQHRARVRALPVEPRAWALQFVVGDYLAAHPPRIAEARVTLAELDQLGMSAVRARMMAHMAMVHAAARQSDTDGAQREADVVLGLARAMKEPMSEIMAFLVLDASMTKADLAMRRKDGDATRAILDSGVALIPHTTAGEWLAAARHAAGLVGYPAPPIEAEHWFQRRGDPAKPARGMVTLLLLERDRRWIEGEDQKIVRLAQRFAGRPFDIILTARTTGYFAGRTPLPPAEEAQLDSGYFYGKKHTPATVAVYETRFKIEADHRRVNDPTPQARHYGGAANRLIVDKGGIVRHVHVPFWGTPQDEANDIAQIEQLLAEP